MDPNPPQLPTGYWTPEKLERMWYYTKWFLSEYQMFIMIGLAVSLSMALLVMVSNLFDRSSNDDDDDEYDYKEI